MEPRDEQHGAALRLVTHVVENHAVIVPIPVPGTGM